MTAVETHIATHYQVHHKTIGIDGQDIFYREAGPKDAPTILLLQKPISAQELADQVAALLAAEPVS